MKTRNELQLLWRQSPSKTHSCSRPVSNNPQCMDCSSLGEHQINIKNITVDSLLWFQGREKTESGLLLQTLLAEAGQHAPKFGASSPCALAPAPALGTQGLCAPRRGPGREQTGGWGCRPRRSIPEEGRFLPWLHKTPQHQALNVPLPLTPCPPRLVTWLGSLVLLLLDPFSLLLGSGLPFRVTGLPSASSPCQGCGKLCPQMELGPWPERLPPGRNWRACWYGRQGGAAATLLLDA